MERRLPAVNLNIDKQLELLSSFHYSEELKLIPLEKTSDLSYYYNNGSFEPGDSEYLYNMIRTFKPRKIIEIGSGNSTLMSLNAINKNKIDDDIYSCEMICVEPYEQTWLEKLGIKIIRKKVEELDLSFFQQLDKNDILFIDSSHVIRPDGDVLYEYNEIIPSLKSGVIIHIHDIFTPRHYPDKWMFDDVRLWNEQYLLEAFLSNNNSVDVMGSLNYLKHNYYKEMSEKCPMMDESREPGSFWLRKI